MNNEHTIVGRALTLSGLGKSSSNDLHNAYDKLSDSNYENFHKEWKKFVKACGKINKNFEDFYKKSLSPEVKE